MSNEEDQRQRLESRLKIVEALITAIGFGGALVDAIKECEDTRTAREVLKAAPWNFSEAVVTHVIDMPYRRTTQRALRELEIDAAEIRLQLGIS